MMIIFKRGFQLRHLVIAFGLIVFILAINTQKVMAGVQEEIPYQIKVNRVHNTITIYEKDDSGKYTVPVKAMVCSVGKKGTQTVLGTYQTKAKYRWKELMGKVWGQYSTRIVGGILFHSVYYYENGNPASLATNQYNKLGSAASHGCIRLSVQDAKWIYDNCPVGTTVVIYDDKESPGPLGKPETIKIPSNVRWDPTDPSSKNPYAKKIPYISGLKHKTISWGAEVDLLKGIKAKSSVGVDITSKLVVEGEVNPYYAGVYKVTYSVVDALGKIKLRTIRITVEKSKDVPVFEGIGDRVLEEGTVIDEDLALEGVKAYCSNIELKQSDIEVTIKPVDEVEYLITYEVNVGKKVTTTKHATYYIDKEAPALTGVSNGKS